MFGVNSKRIRLVFITLGGLSLPLQGCRNENSASGQGVIEAAGAWKLQDIKVCFAEGPQTQAMADLLYTGKDERILVKTSGYNSVQKDLIKETLTAGYTVKETGVRFVGYSPCPTSQRKSQLPTGIQLILFNPEIPQTGLSNAASGFGQTREFETKDGNGGFRRDTSVKTIGVAMELDRFCSNAVAPFIWKVSSIECSKVVILHEMGHVLGLRHEQAHPDASKDPVCQLDYMTGASPADGLTSGKLEPLEPLGVSAKVSAYDPKSIMNYCHFMAYLRGDSRGKMTSAQLSEGDKALLKSVYVSRRKP